MELVPLETKASHGLVNPDPFVMPAINPIWSTSAYDAFTLVPNAKIDDPANGVSSVKVKCITHQLNGTFC